MSEAVVEKPRRSRAFPPPEKAKSSKLNLRGKAKPATPNREDYKLIFLASPSERVSQIKAGVDAIWLKSLLSSLQIDQAALLDALNLKRATINRRAANSQTLSLEDSERAVGLAKLVGQVDAMVEESGDGSDFDTSLWLSTWLRDPLPALGGQAPISLLDTMEGQAIVSQLLAQMQSGAFA